LEVKNDKEWVVILRINFFGLSLCRYHTKDHCDYLVGIPNNFTPSFKIIEREENLFGRQNDRMV